MSSTCSWYHFRHEISEPKLNSSLTVIPAPLLSKNSIVLGRRNEVDGYFYLAKVLDSSLAHEKLVEFLETPRPEITKCSDYDLINIKEAMTYSIFPGSRVLGKIDTQRLNSWLFCLYKYICELIGVILFRFCPGTVLHGSLDATDDRSKNVQDALVVEYCNGEVSTTVPSRLVRIPESLFYWLQKFFPRCAKTNQSRERMDQLDLDINAATARLTMADNETVVKNKLDRFFDNDNPTSWYRYIYSHLPTYDFDRVCENFLEWFRSR